MFRSECSNSLHVSVCAVDSMNDDRRRASKCRVCSKQLKKKPSNLEKRVYSLVDGMGMEYATEVFMFRPAVDDGDYGFKLAKHPFDMLLTKYMLLIEIDGQQHFGDDYKGKCCMEQQYKDVIVDSAAIEEGFCLVRLHYLDDEEGWRSTILAALELQLEHRGGFVYYSPSYNMGVIF